MKKNFAAFLTMWCTSCGNPLSMPSLNGDLTASSSIIGGTTYSGPPTGIGALTYAPSNNRFCTVSVIGPYSVLTASHCWKGGPSYPLAAGHFQDANYLLTIPLLAGGNQEFKSASVDVFGIDKDNDLMMINVASSGAFAPFSGVKQYGLSPSQAGLNNTSVSLWGYGCTEDPPPGYPCPPVQLKYGLSNALVVDTVTGGEPLNGDLIETGLDCLGQEACACFGDSGGPVFSQGGSLVQGVISHILDNSTDCMHGTMSTRVDRFYGQIQNALRSAGAGPPGGPSSGANLFKNNVALYVAVVFP